MLTSGKAAGGVLSVRDPACFISGAPRGRREGTTKENGKWENLAGSGVEAAPAGRCRRGEMQPAMATAEGGQPPQAGQPARRLKRIVRIVALSAS